MAEKIRCERCGKNIERRKDLVVTNRLLSGFLTFHKDCFQAALDEGKFIGRATNTTISNAAWLLVVAGGVVYYITTMERLILLVVIFTILYRLLIWYRFERKLD